MVVGRMVEPNMHRKRGETGKSRLLYFILAVSKTVYTIQNFPPLPFPPPRHLAPTCPRGKLPKRSAKKNNKKVCMNHFSQSQMINNTESRKIK